MRAGRLDRIITLERSVRAVDDYGAPSFTWTAYAENLPAERVEASTDEFMRDFGASEETAAVFRIRWRDDVILADRVIHAGLIFNIRQLKEIGRRKGLELRCVSSGQEATP